MPLTSMDRIRPLRDAILMHNKQYSSGGADYSVTTLLDPPRLVMLNKRHLHKVPICVEDLFHSYTGTAGHEYWEKMLSLIPNTPYECETRLSTRVLDRKVSGAFDCVYSEEDMYDLKTTSVWKAVFGSKADWAAQLNIYRWLYHKHRKIWLKTLRILAQFRDWNKNEMYRSSYNYPKRPAVEYRLPLWEPSQTKGFLEDRVRLMIDNENVKDDDLPMCSYEDMWCRPDQVAVMSTRRKRAVRVLSSPQAAKNFVKKYLQGPKCKDTVQTLSYEVRPATRTRCESWCPIHDYCNQFNDYIAAKAKKGD